VLGLAGFLTSEPRAADEPAGNAVKLESLTFDAFKSRISRPKDKGHKYTLVDVWSTTCGPCMENFPHLVAMSHKYADRGLQTVSLSLDDTTDVKAVETARTFLREQKATFLNVLLDEDFGVGFDKLDINTIPAVFVFDPEGKVVKKYTMDDPNDQFTYEQVEKDVASLLDARPVATK
jgi:thiol-disulfide isomerase/thioredoxin